MGVQCGIAAASVVELFRVSQIGNVQQEAVCSFDSTVPLSVSCVEVALYRGSRVLVPVPSCNKFVTVSQIFCPFLETMIQMGRMHSGSSLLISSLGPRLKNRGLGVS